ncbi:MAG: SRPBCC domain-containing protein [bacterium]|nr:SRPBCC domain-containing protein [bacterium]
MEKLEMTVKIKAPKEHVYKTMLEDATYREWTSVFVEGSHYIGSWEKGSTILFVDPKGQGMAAIVEEHRPAEFVSTMFTGLVLDGVEDTESDEAKAIIGAHENYTFTEVDGVTELRVDLDTTEDYKEMFDGVYPKALELLKTIAER